MDETRVRAVIREEIALAIKTLGEVAGNAVPSLYAENRTGEADGAVALQSAAGVYFESAYEANCEVADEQRAEAAQNPFAEPDGDAVTVEVKALVNAGILDALREMRSTFYMSGLDDDYRIAERLDYVIALRGRSAGK
jgi:hypothetical protein